MGIGTSIFLIAVGAILYFAVNADISGLEISTVGLILMVVGVLGLMISLFLMTQATRRRRGEPATGRSCASASLLGRVPDHPGSERPPARPAPVARPAYRAPAATR